jgi:hypothetical protein
MDKDGFLDSDEFAGELFCIAVLSSSFFSTRSCNVFMPKCPKGRSCTVNVATESRATVEAMSQVSIHYCIRPPFFCFDFQIKFDGIGDGIGDTLNKNF